jgi:hypothetical protein
MEMVTAGILSIMQLLLAVGGRLRGVFASCPVLYICSSSIINQAEEKVNGLDRGAAAAVCRVGGHRKTVLSGARREVIVNLSKSIEKSRKLE